jgi:hypothetical protein
MIVARAHDQLYVYDVQRVLRGELLQDDAQFHAQAQVLRSDSGSCGALSLGGSLRYAWA